MKSSVAPVLCRRPAMNTWFEIVLHGNDPEHLSAAGEAALDEIERIEKLLSRFDPASEVSRINREAAVSPVLLDIEMTGIIATCQQAWFDTDGYFDITVGSAGDAGFLNIEFDEEARTIAFRASNIRLDFGGFGKGYALDCAAQLLREAGITGAILHGGTSSVLAIGSDIGEQRWRVDLRSPWNPGAVLNTVFLQNEALSTSATGPDIPLSDLAPQSPGPPLPKQATCTVITETAAEAEILSTALLCMGRQKAAIYRANAGARVFWANEPESKCVLL